MIHTMNLFLTMNEDQRAFLREYDFSRRSNIIVNNNSISKKKKKKTNATGSKSIVYRTTKSTRRTTDKFLSSPLLVPTI